MKYTSKFVTQIEDVGYFAEITVGIKKESKKGLVIEFDPEYAKEWQTGARFGLEYAWERASRSDWKSGIHFQVCSIRGFFTDTSQLVVAFVAYDVFWKATNIARPKVNPEFDPVQKMFLFPK